MPQKTVVEKIIAGVGSVPSLLIHTVLFAGSFVSAVVGIVDWSAMLLVLTTIVSLEAIYLAIFIQMSVNRHAVELAEVSEDVEDIQEDIEEISQDVDEIQKDVDEIQEDVEDIQEDVEEISEDDALPSPKETLESLLQQIQEVVKKLDEHKKK